MYRSDCISHEQHQSFEVVGVVRYAAQKKLTRYCESGCQCKQNGADYNAR